MVVVPLTQPDKEHKVVRRVYDSAVDNWALFAAAGGLLAGGILLLTGNKKAGLVTAVSGTALAALDQQEVVREWWNALPTYIDKAQNILGKVEASVSELEAQHARIHNILTR